MQLDARQRAMLQEMGVMVWQPAGVQDAEVPLNSAVPVSSVSPVATVPPASVVPTVPAAPAALGELASLDWPELLAAASTCRACGLCAGRRQSSLQAPPLPALACDWMVVGDPPDADEDRLGSPFAGADGVLLGNMLRALGLQRINGLSVLNAADPAPLSQDPAQRVYVANVVKCRPDHGRLAQPDELQQCAAFLQREIALVRPRVILALGRFAIQLLLGETPALAEQPLGKLRGTVYSYRGLPVVVGYHPRALLRHAADKAKSWQDLCLAADSVDAAG